MRIRCGTSPIGLGCRPVVAGKDANETGKALKYSVGALIRGTMDGNGWVSFRNIVECCDVRTGAVSLIDSRHSA